MLEACVSSAVLYNCETWGNADMRSLETYHKALKYMLGVRTQVCNEFPYIELAKPTLTSIVQQRQYIFFKKCIAGKDWPLQRYIIRKAMDVNCSYILHYQKLVSDYTSGKQIVEKSLDKLKRNIEIKSTQGKSKYQSYMSINPTLSRPNIYNNYCHNLQIELGRHKRPRIPKEERLCLCGDMETEQHLTTCIKYKHLSDKYHIYEDITMNLIQQPKLLNC